MKNIKINNVDFELYTSRMHPVAPIRGCCISEIFEVYNKPSVNKVRIWKEWCRWCNDLNEQGIECGIQIESHTVSFFTISGSICADGKCYDLWITPAHNKIYQHQPI